MAQRNQRQNTPKGPALGVIFWIACILLVLLVFLFNRENIRRVLQNTDIIEVITEDPTEVPTPVTQESQPEIEVQEPVPEVVSEPEPESIEPQEITENQPEPEPEPEPQSTTESQTRVRTYNLYFVRIAEDESVILEPRARGIRFVDSPLTATLQALIAGPVEAETAQGYMSVIPEGSQLISASIRGDTAFLNFNEAFRFNSLGYEGQKAQLQQIIYTATEFPTVSQVQILIDGQIVNYLGGDSLYVGAPLQRGSL